MTKKTASIISTFIVFFLLLIAVLLDKSLTFINESELPFEIVLPQEVIIQPTPTPTVLGSSSDTEPVTIITRVIDGDTVELNTGETVRYIGIDAPEVGKEGSKTAQCYAEEAEQRNSELVLNKAVRLEKDTSETDRYGRLLRYVYVEDTLVNESLVKEGFAFAKSYKPDTKLQDIFKIAQQAAKNEKKGLWGKCF